MSDDLGMRKDPPLSAIKRKNIRGARPRVHFDFDLPSSRGDGAESDAARGVKRRGTPHPTKGGNKENVSELLDGNLPPPPKFNKYGPTGGRVALHDTNKSPENGSGKEEASTANSHHRDEGTRGDDDEEEGREEIVVEEQALNEEQGEGEAEEEEQAWKAFVDKKKADGTACYNLNRFLKEGERWCGASQKLGAEHQKFNENMNEKIEGFLKFINDIFKNEHQKLDELEAGCKALLIQNHRKREAFVDRLHKSNETWKDNYETLLAKTMDVDEGEEEEVDGPAPVDGQQKEPKEAGQQSEKGVATPASDEVEDDDELPEEVLNDINPKRAETVDRYLKNEERLHRAKEKFEGILNATREELNGKVGFLLSMVERIHDEQANQIVEVERDIQSTMMANHHRGEQIAQQAEAAAARRKNFFGDMLQNLTSKVKIATRMTDSKSK